jgi:hypothetical protein
MFDSMYVANVVDVQVLEGADQRGRRRHNGMAARGRWLGKEGPPLWWLRPGGGEGASRHGPAANYEPCTERRAEEKAVAARAVVALGEAIAVARAAVAIGGAADAVKGVVAEPPSERALRLTWLAWRER